ncbi:MAG: dihydrodipicolinate synthase family protein [Alphaproteobacteria bacterium]
MSDLNQSVVVVPPLAWKSTFEINFDENRKIISHIEAAKIRILMYGGNANFYHLPISKYREILSFLSESVRDDTWVLPAVGPDFGRMVDQAPILKDLGFPAAMVLPNAPFVTAEGIESGIRKFSDMFGGKIVLYCKSESYLPLERIVSLCNDGLVSFVKYAVARKNPQEDEFLGRMTDAIGEYLCSGIGERPVVQHAKRFGIKNFTTGSGAIAPALSQELLQLVRKGDLVAAEKIRKLFLPLEDCRDKYGPARVLHDAVTLSGIADCGPVQPLLSNLNEQEMQHAKSSALNLLAMEQKHTKNLAAQKTVRT